VGCDIHFVVEKKMEGRWVGVYATDVSPRLIICGEGLPAGQASENDVRDAFMGTYDRRPAMKQRNYDFFAKLAGVRGEGPAPKGLPTDLSELSDIVLGGDSDLHSHSHDSLDHFAACWLMSFEDHARHGVAALLGGVEGAVILRFVTGDPYTGEENDRPYRVVYAFDN
jgi:hypothetical protein